MYGPSVEVRERGNMLQNLTPWPAEATTGYDAIKISLNMYVGVLNTGISGVG